MYKHLYKETVLWKRTLDLSLEMIELLSKLPKDKLDKKGAIEFLLTNVQLYITEGYSKVSQSEMVKYFNLALENLDKASAEIDLLIEDEQLVKEDSKIVTDLMIKIDGLLYSYVEKIKYRNVPISQIPKRKKTKMVLRKEAIEKEEEEIQKQKEADEALLEAQTGEQGLEFDEDGLPIEYDEMGQRKNPITYTFRRMPTITLEQTDLAYKIETISKFIVENPDIALKIMQIWLMDRYQQY